MLRVRDSEIAVRFLCGEDEWFEDDEIMSNFDAKVTINTFYSLIYNLFWNCVLKYTNRINFRRISRYFTMYRNNLFSNLISCRNFPIIIKDIDYSRLSL